jgi:competence protein ComEC
MKYSKIKKIFIVLILLSLSSYFSITYFLPEKNILQVSFINVGQGDAIYISSPYGHNIIIDFGSERGLVDLDKRISWWNKKIDLIIISHSHDDHISGLIAIIKKYSVEKIMLTGAENNSIIYSELLKLIKEKNIEILRPHNKQKIILGNNCYLRTLFPQEDLNNQIIKNLNNTSIVNQLDCLNFKFLFTGDIEMEVENKILEKNIDIKSDVLKVAHHGSISSSQEKFLEKVSPQIAIIMLGKNNSFGHPSYRIIKRLEKLNAQIFRTDLDLTIDLFVDEKNIYLKN